MILINNIRILNPGDKTDRNGDIVISDGKIMQIGDYKNTGEVFETTPAGTAPQSPPLAPAGLSLR